MQKGLIEPVDETYDGRPSPQHEIHQARRNEILLVLDPLLVESGLVPEVQSLERAQRVLGAQTRHQPAQRFGQCGLEDLQSDLWEEADEEGEDVLLLAGLTTPHQVDGHDEHRREHDPGDRRDVTARPEIVPVITANQVLDDEGVGAQEPELKRLDGQEGSPGWNHVSESKSTQQLRLQDENPAETHDQRCVHDRRKRLGAVGQLSLVDDQSESADRGSTVDRLELRSVEVVLVLGLELIVRLLPREVVRRVLRGRWEIRKLVDVKSKEVQHVLVVETAPLVPDELQIEPTWQKSQESGAC